MSSSYACPSYDRFIGPKVNQNNFGIYSPNATSSQGFQDSSYSQLIRKNLFGHVKASNDQITTSDSRKDHTIHPLDINLPANQFHNEDKNVLSPVKILDVPNIKDDFYLNLIDWHERGPIGIALNDEAYIYTPTDIIRMTKCPFNTYISSVKFNESILSVGLSNGMVEIFDLEKSSLIRAVQNHSLRVSALAFSQNLMITGSKDKSINLNDLRLKESLVKTIQYHSGEICTIKVKPDQPSMFASGANDNKVYIWDVRHHVPLSTLKGHKGAVKAIRWCPWKSNTLATGGGKNDRTIKIWGENMNLVCQKETKSQITGLQWNSRHRFLVSSQGANSNEICLWNWDGKSKLSKTNGSKNFSKRVLSLIQSKEQDMLCTLSSDQTMKFYEFSNTQNSKKQIFDSNAENNQSYRIL